MNISSLFLILTKLLFLLPLGSGQSGCPLSPGNTALGWLPVSDPPGVRQN